MSDATGPILILGGSGVFGSRIAMGLWHDGIGPLVLAGRDLSRLSQIAQPLDAATVALDRDAHDFAQHVADLRPFVVIDAAGPFQSYTHDRYHIADAAISAGAHYLDLSDDGEFTTGIESFDARAKDKGLAVLSGVSSVPAISAAAVRGLTDDMERIDLIDTAILPGNRAPRGLSVVKAVLSQAGVVLPNGAFGWIGSRKTAVPGHPRMVRRASPIGAPDLTLFGQHLGARHVRFSAGLELPVLHHGLALIAHARRAGLVTRPERFAALIRRLAALLESFGTDRGAMVVRVIGKPRRGEREQRTWSLLAEAGVGPHVPAIPARILVRRLIDDAVTPGARPAISEISLDDIQTAAPELNLRFHKEVKPWKPLFAEVLGDDFDQLPGQLRDLHDVVARRRFTGRVQVRRATRFLPAIIARLFRFPPSTDDTDVTVTMTAFDGRETWVREIGGHSFRSTLSPAIGAPNRLNERFGPLSFAIDLTPDQTTLRYPVSSGKAFGAIPIPRFLLPISDTVEALDPKGRATFDVRLSLPLIGQIVHYKGWLIPDD